MTISQNNKLTMYEAVLETLNRNSSIWKNNTVLTEVHTEFAGLLPQIRKAGVIKATSSKGVTQSKSSKKEEMAQRASKIAGLASAYAARNKNTTLQEALNFSRSDLFLIKDNLAIDRCSVVHDQIKPILSELKAYGITSAEMDALQTAITTFQALIGQKGQQQSGLKATNQALDGLFKQADSLLKMQVDKLMLRYTDSNREFYDAYLSSRITRHLGGSRKPAVAKAA